MNPLYKGLVNSGQKLWGPSSEPVPLHVKRDDTGAPDAIWPDGDKWWFEEGRVLKKNTRTLRILK